MVIYTMPPLVASVARSMTMALLLPAFFAVGSAFTVLPCTFNEEGQGGMNRNKFASGFKNRYRQHRDIWDSNFKREDNEGWVDVFDYLYKQSNKLNFYFTWEYAESTDSSESALELASITQEDVPTIDLLVKKLRRDLDSVSVELVRDNPAVIRVADASLKESNYPLNGRVTLDYSGTLRGMILEIHKAFPSVDEYKHGALPIPPIDYATPVKVSVKDKKILDILTDAVSLAGDRRLLWVAETRNVKGRRETNVYYSPPVKDEGDSK